jgi:MoaA/NifB/PqqE/SkfB family radical SAM enzyme|tara:strand:+ start:5386 stop:6519 length:1134 start_codon:yes stop_codon:yes gene_type:complete
MTDNNVFASTRDNAKAYEEMNLPMTGVPEQDNITILDDKPPLFHNIPEHDIENNPFNFLYVDLTYDCNMECEFCYNPVRTYGMLDIEWFEDVCARLPHPVSFRLLGGEPTLYPHLGRALDACTKYGHQAAVVTNGLRLSSMSFAKKLKVILDRNPTVNVSLSLNGGLYHDDWYVAIDGESRRAKKAKALENMLELGYRRICINAIIVRGLNEGLVQEFYDKALQYPGQITNIRFRTAAKQGRWNDEIDAFDEDEHDQTSYTGLELDNYIKTIIPEANKPLKIIRDGYNPSTGSGVRLNNPDLKCNQCCFMYYIRPQLWVATIEFGSHNSALCWRRGQLVQGNQVIQPFHHYMDELSRYIQTYKPDGIRETNKDKKKS